MKKGEIHPLRSACRQHNLTIVKLAEEAKVGASTIWRAENHYSINAESRRRLCTYFGMDSQERGLLDRSAQNLTLEQNRLAIYPYEAITKIIGSALFFQEYSNGGKQASKKADGASQESLDLWKQAHNLSWKGVAANTGGEQMEVSQLIETALQLRERQEEKDFQHSQTNSRNSLTSLSPVFGQLPSFVDY